MLPYLRIFLIHLWVACVAGAVVIAGLALGLFSIWTFVWAAVIGLVIGIPAGMINWAYLRPNRSREEGYGGIHRILQGFGVKSAPRREV